MDEVTARNLNPQVLAFVGDAVYSLYIRQKMVLNNEHLKGANLHNEVTNYVKATGQSNFINTLLPMFTETELAVFKRARNYKTQSQAKNASIIDYRRATGFEAVIGYLYLIGSSERINEILKLSVGEKHED
jgi:ribonuclease-3 family protein